MVSLKNKTACKVLILYCTVNHSNAYPHMNLRVHTIPPSPARSRPSPATSPALSLGGQRNFWNDLARNVQKLVCQIVQERKHIHMNKKENRSTFWDVESFRNDDRWLFISLPNSCIELLSKSSPSPRSAQLKSPSRNCHRPPHRRSPAHSAFW